MSRSSSSSSGSVASSAGAAAAVLLLFAQPVLGHLALWHPSVYGFNASGPQAGQYYNAPINTDYLHWPLRKDSDMSFKEWWFHGLTGATPNDIMELPAGGSVTLEISCNKAFTSYGVVPSEIESVNGLPCNINMGSDGKAHYGDPNVAASNGPLHTASLATAAGCGLSIAYKSDITQVGTEDLVVFSTNASCPWTRDIVFEIPADMPPCPNGKCICAWNWSHGAQHGEGYGGEVYMVGFDCNIIGSKSTTPLAKAQSPKVCNSDPSTCVKGAKQGLYWEGAQADGWNIPDTSIPGTPMNPPSYNTVYGFANGAQNDIFESGSSSSSSSSDSNVEKNVKSLSASSTTSLSTRAPLAVVAAASSTTKGSSVAADGVPVVTVTDTRTHIHTVWDKRALQTPGAESEKRRRRANNQHLKRRLEFAGLGQRST